MESGIERIAGALRELLQEREIIARCELLLRTYEIVERASLSDEENSELAGLVGERIAPGIFAGLMGKEPVIFGLPKLDSYTQMDGRIFHFLHTKRYSKQDFDTAKGRFLRSKPKLRRMLYNCMSGRIREFMADAGYVAVQENAEAITFQAEGRRVRASIAGSVRSVKPEEIAAEKGVDRVILVPSSESLEPFVQFYRESGAEAERKDLQIWIMNLEKGTIDPFIGYTTDLDIYNQFDNPRLAEMVRNNWGREEEAQNADDL